MADANRGKDGSKAVPQKKQDVGLFVKMLLSLPLKTTHLNLASLRKDAKSGLLPKIQI